jgi:hypothetical protein
MEMLGPFSKLSIYIGNTRSIETRCEGFGWKRDVKGVAYMKGFN